MQTRRKDPCFPPILSICTENRFAEIFISTVQCFAGYFDIEYGHLLDGEKQMGVIINTCKEFNLLPLNKGYLPIRATPPSRLGINP